MKGRGRQRWRTFFQYAHVVLSLTGASCWRAGRDAKRHGLVTPGMTPAAPSQNFLYGMRSHGACRADATGGAEICS
jgi:hypothetical protein